MIECSKASLLRCRNCKHVKCDKYKIMQILIRIGAVSYTHLTLPTILRV